MSVTDAQRPTEVSGLEGTSGRSLLFVLIKHFVRVVDILATVFLGTVLGLGVLAVVAFPRPRRHRMLQGKKRVVCLNPMRWEWVEQKGILSHVFLLNMNGYWDRFYLIHANTLADRRIAVNERIEVLEYTRSRYPRLATRGLRYLGLLLSEIVFLQHMYRFIRREGVVVVRSQEPYINGLRGLLLSRLCGCFFVQDLRANYDLIYRETGRLAYPFLRFRWLEKVLEWLVLPRADMVFGGNENNRDFGLKNGARTEVTFTVRPVGVGVEHFDSLENRRNLKVELGLANRPLLLWVGRLSVEKYPADVLRAAGLLASQHPELMTVMVGDGPERPTLEALVQKLGITERVLFLGFQSQERVRDLLFTADVIVVTMGGSALVEAALSGSPIVAYDAEWHGELIQSGETGLLVPFRNIPALADGIDRVLSDAPLGARFGQAARLKAFAQHHPDIVSKNEEMCFDWLLQDRTLSGAKMP